MGNENMSYKIFNSKDFNGENDKNVIFALKGHLKSLSGKLYFELYNAIYVDEWGNYQESSEDSYSYYVYSVNECQNKKIEIYDYNNRNYNNSPTEKEIYILYSRSCLKEKEEIKRQQEKMKIIGPDENTIYPYIISVENFESNFIQDDGDKLRVLCFLLDKSSSDPDPDRRITQALLKKAREILQEQINYNNDLKKQYEQFLGYYHQLESISDEQNGYINALLNIASNPLIANKISESTREYEEQVGDEKYKNAANFFNNRQPQTIARIINTIGNNRPKYSCDFIKNVLICIAQNFITIFAGQPGTGKTSLCDIIASAFGLDNMIYYDLDMSRYISVSVERGWNSKSELIGYFNALSGRYDDSGIGIYHALKVLHYERNLKTHPFFILLDEANLSPVEHYWSEFMKLADVSELHKDCRGEIPIGGGEKLKVPNNLRFLATVNNDQTTEPLSPRLIDRTSVIKLPKIDEKFDESKINVKTDLTWDALLENINTYANAVAKGANDANNNANEIGNDKKAITMEDVYEAFESHNLPVSRRIKNRIEVYLKVAVNDFNIKEDKAVDFAIAQNLLPKINGFCEEYKDLCTALKNVTGNYPLTDAFLDKLSAMLEEGTNEYIQYTSI